MKNSLFLAGWLALAAGGARADGFTNLWTTDFANAGVVPDASTLGWSDTRTITGFGGYTNADVNVTLALSGGYNGDLYGYLVHDNTLVVLLNRPGLSSSGTFGYGEGGLAVTFDDQALQTTDIHLYQTVPGWTISDGAAWQPDGRNISPLSSGSVFDTAVRQSGGGPLGLFNGTSVDGGWTLFLADLTTRDQSTVLSWGLEVSGSPVPEPTVWALLTLAGSMMALARRRAVRAFGPACKSVKGGSGAA
jgi:hypothetical protein